MEQAPAQTTPRVRSRRRAAAAGAKSPRWLRMCLDLSLVPPANGKMFSIDTTGRKLRVIVFAPVPIAAALALALFGDKPWVHELLRTVQHWLAR